MTTSLTENERSLLRDAFEDAPFEFWARDLDGVCIVANAATRRLGELLGRKVEDAAMPPDVIASWQANNRRAYAGEVVQNEFEYGEGDRKRYLSCYIVPLRINREIRGILGFNIDVSEQKRIEQALREVDRRRGEFLGVLSHELRNPLAVIASSLRTLDNAELDDHAQRAVGVIDRQTRQLSRLVDDLLDVTRISSGKIGLRRGRVDLVQLVRTTVDDHRAQLADRVVSLRLPDAPVWTHGDATRLAQILGNLLHNAGKFTAPGDAIAVSLAIETGRAALAVSDTGMGIDERWLDRLFVPFVQAKHRAHGGLGLGLALVKTLVEMHAGDVRAQSAGFGQGACFTITLPILDGEPAEPTPVRAVTGTPRKVLVIEDNQDVAEWLATALAFSGHEVTITADGEAGLAKARELDPDVILCDIGLPGTLDGYAVAQRLCEDAALAAAYRVALTGYAQPEDQKRARAAGFEAHLSKPPDLHALERLLAALPRRP